MSSCFRLVTAEERLRQEQLKQQELPSVLSEKQRIIDQQEQQIRGLNDANNRLLEALNDLKERYHRNQQPNGHISKPSPAKLAVVDTNGQFKSSEC